MSTIPTQNPVPSEAASDLKYNAGKIDEFVTSMKNKYIDRFGQEHFTIEGLRWISQQAISQFGYITLDSFQKGAEITLPNQVLRDETTGEYYRWDGVLPKSVPVDSTPDSSGGIGFGGWLSIGDSSLRVELNNSLGANKIKWRKHLLGERLDKVAYSDDFDTLKEWAEFPAEKKVFVSGSYVLDETLNIQCDEFSTDGTVTINCTKPMIAIKFGSDEYLATKYTSTPIYSGGNKISIGDASNIEKGMVFFLHDQRDYSFSKFRSYYRQGEAVRASRVNEGVIYIDGSAIGNYPTGSTVVFPSMQKKIINGDINVNFPVESGEHQYSANSLGVLITHLIDSNISGLKVTVKQGAYSVIMRECVNVFGSNVVAIQSLANPPTRGLDYGLNIANCQNLSIDGYFSSERHGVCHSGNGYIVNRFCHVSGEVRTSGRGGAAAADWHGNTEHCSFSGYMNGISLGGDNNSIISGSIIDAIPEKENTPSVYCSEIKGINFNISNCDIKNYGNPETTSNAVIDFGGNKADIDQDNKGGLINLSGSRVISPNAKHVLKIRNRGLVGKRKISVNLSDVTVIAENAVRPIWIDAISGDLPFSVNAMNISLDTPTESTNVISTLISSTGNQESGIADIKLVKGDKSANHTIELNSNFINPISILMSVSEPNAGGSDVYSLSFIRETSSTNKNSAKIRVKRYDGNAFINDDTVRISYTVFY
ncbi:TPA: hypothetical protein SMQ30_002911 [Proteus mirabilis]|nr:hypothetical protein [Proteus mirabilis]